jgi:multidrug efflux pump subunit AcrA (membrane-fusion protein)
MPAFHTPITYRLGLLATAMVVIGCSPQRPSAPAESAVYVTTVRNETSDMQRVFSGSIRPRIESDIGFRVGGRVTERLVELGEPVRAGQVMARLDPTDYRLAVQAAADQQRAAEVEAVQSASDAERFRRLLGDGSVGAADAERQQARADAAAARLKQAQSQLELARNRAGYAALTAPFDGVVTALRLELGQMVTEGQAVVSVARPGELEVVVDVPEALVAKLQQWRARIWHRIRGCGRCVLGPADRAAPAGDGTQCPSGQPHHAGALCHGVAHSDQDSAHGHERRSSPAPAGHHDRRHAARGRIADHNRGHLRVDG